MAKNKYYAVKKGRKTGIFNSWEECKKQIEGFSGAIYKGFASYEDAYNFVNGEIKNKVTHKKNIKQIEAYVDGSYFEEYNKYSYGCVILKKDEVIKLSGIGENENYVVMRNVAGELLGAMKVIEWAYENNYDLITIHHDYEGIERWANGSWKANKQGTKEYVEFIRKYRQYLKIQFKKVKAHSGNVYNDEADNLAKQAILGEIKESIIEEKAFDERIKVFDKVMSSKDRTKNSIEFIFKQYRISESKLKKFVKEIWVLKGNDKNEIDSINLEVDIQNSKIEWSIKTKEGKNQEFKIYI
ncbi:ribonuclease H family protein [Clostridium sp. ZS2-4]|uniref:ribonuclease H family protein n=1 Tax=Clostridium sp. ZS2-4 TaxID=2987703 RepID=UPI00227BDBDB|nr:ribonuclease H family protein [Clostridium sp. ZS2-4]MCY6355179.1 ribonuclease H family protein [Clostridium sp. ZS2-4]